MAANNGAGMNIGFPDVCLTPAGPTVVPVPYPNLAMNMMAAAFSLIVFITKRPGLNMGSTIPMTTGDEGGVAHPTIKGPGSYTAGNPKVFVEKLPAINLTCPTKGNGVNNGLGMVAVPSIVNVFYSLALSPVTAPSANGSQPLAGPPDPYARALDLGAAEQLSETMTGELCASELADDGLALVQIRMFARTLPSVVWSMLRAFEERGMRGLILDLSGCPGGDVEACLSLAGDFLPAGSELAIVRDTDGDEVLHRSLADAPFSFPMVVVVDERTASAAEVFAGCLAFHRRAVLVGTRTFGKGAIQELRSSASGELHTASVAELWFPNGARIEGEGLRPDVLASSREEALTRARDALRTAEDRGA